MTEAGSASQPPHAGGNVTRLRAVLDQAGDDHAGVGEQRVETGAAARAMGEHLAGPSVRIEADRYREALPAMFELDNLRGAPIGEPDPRLARLPGSRSPTAEWRARRPRGAYGGV